MWFGIDFVAFAYFLKDFSQTWLSVPRVAHQPLISLGYLNWSFLRLGIFALVGLQRCWLGSTCQAMLTGRCSSLFVPQCLLVGSFANHFRSSPHAQINDLVVLTTRLDLGRLAPGLRPILGSVATGRFLALVGARLVWTPLQHESTLLFLPLILS